MGALEGFALVVGCCVHLLGAWLVSVDGLGLGRCHGLGRGRCHGLGHGLGLGRCHGHGLVARAVDRLWDLDTRIRWDTHGATAVRGPQEGARGTLPR